jgi:hypothetical protein
MAVSECRWLAPLEGAFAQAFPDSLNMLVLDHSGAHTAHRIRWPDQVRDVWLPPDCPELNPRERGWRDWKDDFSWPQVTALEAQQECVGNVLPACEAPVLQSLTRDAYLVQAMNALCT